MTNQLYLRVRCEVTLDDEGRSLVGVEKFNKDYDFVTTKSGQVVKMRLLQAGNAIEAETVIYNVNTDILRILRVNEYDKLTDIQKGELSKIRSPVLESIRQLVGLIKQEHSRFDIRDDLIANVMFEWSPGDGDWYPIPRGLTISGTMYGLGNMNDARAKIIQDLLSENEYALIATSYLHQAINAKSTRYQWIYATIAAELAIKEILTRIEPNLEVIFRTLPSPPLDKLYGDVLESVAGVKSQSLGKLRKGAERRNKLVHSARDEDIPSYDETHEYIHFIEERINWLLDLWRKIDREKGPMNLTPKGQA